MLADGASATEEYCENTPGRGTASGHAVFPWYSRSIPAVFQRYSIGIPWATQEGCAVVDAVSECSQ
jgi:hypothetical protein